MGAVFLKIVNMSITASWLIMAVILARLLLKKAPKWISCVLWALAAIRLMIPFSFESALSLIPSSDVFPVEAIYSTNPQIANNPYNWQMNTGFSALDSSGNLSFLQDVSTGPALRGNLFIIGCIWLVGVAVLLLYALISYIKVKQSVKASIPIKDSIFACDEVKAPFILGVFRPSIYVPSSMNEKTLTYVIHHEKAHLQRHDHWWKPLGFLLLSVYWFNPLCWIAYILLCRDIEMACDEKVIRDMDKDDMAAYSQALLDCSFPRKRIAACLLAFGEVGVKERVKGVLNYKKPSFWIILAAILVCIVLAVCLLTNPKSSDATSTSVAASFEGDGYVGISYEGRRYVPFCAISNSARGKLLGYIGDDPEDQIYTWKGYSPEEWIISIYHSGLMDTSMLMRETHVIDIPGQVTIEYSWNNSLANDLSPGEDATDKSFHLTIGADGVKSIEITTPYSSGGCENADGSLYHKGEQIWLEPLNGLEDLRGVTIIALDKNDAVLWTASVPNTADNSGFTRLTQDGWTITDLGGPAADGAARVDLNALREKYPEYFDLGTFKGLEVYVWQMGPDSYSCGVMLGTNRNKTLEELMNLKGASIAEMSAILSTYDIDEKDIFVIPWMNPISSYLADYWISLENEDSASVERRKQEYIDRIREMLFGDTQI